MEKKEIFEIIKNIVIQQLEVKEDLITLKAKFVEDLGADSLDIIEMVMTVEEKFGIEIPDKDVENLLTLEDLVNYLYNQIGKQSEKLSLSYSI